MQRELTTVGMKGLLLSVGLAVLESLPLPLGDPSNALLVKQTFLAVAIFRMCAIFTPSKKGGAGTLDETLQDYPLGQLSVDLIFWGVVYLVQHLMTGIGKNLTEEERLHHGKLVDLAVTVFTSLNLLVISRVVFLATDTMGGGQLSQWMRCLVSKEVEGLPVGVTNVNE